MVELNGHISIHRKILEWEWYKNVNAFKLFIHCLLMANWKDKKWEGKTIKRGQFVTSLDNLASETGLSKMEVRTALKHLELTHELTHTGTSKYSIITLLNYSQYQKVNTRVNTQLTHNQHSNNIQLTFNQHQLNNVNNSNNSNKENKYIDSTSLEEEDEYIEGAEKLPEGFWDAVGGYDE